MTEGGAIMNFSDFEQVDEGQIYNPYAGKAEDGWLAGTTSSTFLQEYFGHCKTLDECIEATESEGLKLFFEYLKTQQ